MTALGQNSEARAILGNARLLKSNTLDDANAEGGLDDGPPPGSYRMVDNPATPWVSRSSDGCYDDGSATSNGERLPDSFLIYCLTTGEEGRMGFDLSPAVRQVAYFLLDAEAPE
ncbi:hypothetical protein BH23ACT9_BH23ACT9_21860 [soil metagenome]